MKNYFSIVKWNFQQLLDSYWMLLKRLWSRRTDRHWKQIFLLLLPLPYTCIKSLFSFLFLYLFNKLLYRFSIICFPLFLIFFFYVNCADFLVFLIFWKLIHFICFLSQKLNDYLNKYSNYNVFCIWKVFFFSSEDINYASNIECD